MHTIEFASVILQEDLVAMEDGVRLYTRIVRPRSAQRVPIVLRRTPYAKPAAEPADAAQLAADPFVQAGYAVVEQHCRGTGSSEGRCVPYIHEREDGLCTLRYLRSLPFYNQEIFLLGGSYTATVHLAYLDTNPEDVKGAALSVQTDRMQERDYHNGCCIMGCNFGWVVSMMTQNGAMTALRPAKETVRIFPYADMARRTFGFDVPLFTERLTHPEPEAEIWSKICPGREAMTKLRIPIMLIDGWYDFYIHGMFSMWERMPQQIRAQSCFFVGPYGHATSINANAPAPGTHTELPENLALRWFEHLRKKAALPDVWSGQLHFYRLGADQWEHCIWPRTDTQSENWYLTYDGQLSTEAQSGTDGCTYRSDPMNPVEFNAFSLTKQPEQVPTGVLEFISAEVAQSTDYLGKAQLHLTVRSDCADTAFFARLEVMTPNGIWNLTETETTLRHQIADYSAGNTVAFTLDFPPCAFRLNPGDRLRLLITSSSVHKFLPHPNVAGQFALQKTVCVAENTVFPNGTVLMLPKQA